MLQLCGLINYWVIYCATIRILRYRRSVLVAPTHGLSAVRSLLNAKTINISEESPIPILTRLDVPTQKYSTKPKRICTINNIKDSGTQPQLSALRVRSISWSSASQPSFFVWPFDVAGEIKNNLFTGKGRVYPGGSRQVAIFFEM